MTIVDPPVLIMPESMRAKAEADPFFKQFTVIYQEKVPCQTESIATLVQQMRSQKASCNPSASTVAPIPGRTRRHREWSKR